MVALTSDVHVHVPGRVFVCFACRFAGSITLDLNRIPKPAKDQKKCTLKMMRTDGKVPTLNLFKNKRCKGWWPVAAREKDEETGEEHLVLKVCSCCGRCCCCDVTNNNNLVKVI